MTIDRTRIKEIDDEVRVLLGRTARRCYFITLTRDELDAYVEYLFERAIRLEEEVNEALP